MLANCWYHFPGANLGGWNAGPFLESMGRCCFVRFIWLVKSTIQTFALPSVLPLGVNADAIRGQCAPVCDLIFSRANFRGHDEGKEVYVAVGVGPVASVMGKIVVLPGIAVVREC